MTYGKTISSFKDLMYKTTEVGKLRVNIKHALFFLN